MNKIYWYIAALVLILIYIYFVETLPRTVYSSFGSALGYVLFGMVGANLWRAIANRKKK